MFYFIVLAILILLTLTIVAGYYLWQVRKLRKKQTEQQSLNQAAWKAHQEELAKDVRFIANSMLQEQCEITEGCLRLQYLMDKLDEGLKNKPEFQAIHMHCRQTAHMPTHEAYKALGRKEQFKLDKDRFALEEENREQVLKEATTLLTYRFERLNPN